MPSLASEALSTRRILFTFLPLALMWIMMAFEQPLTSAVIGRLADAERNLAAFGVAFSLTILIQSPAVQLLVAATALSTSREAYDHLLRFATLLVLGLTALDLLIAVTPLFSLVARHLMGIPEDLVAPSRSAFLLMAPWPASVGYRRLWQGVLIRHGRAGLIPVTMLSRLGAALLFAALALALPVLAGADAGALLSAAALVVGAIATRLFAAPVLAGLAAAPRNEPRRRDEVLSGRALLRFFAPLALTSVITVIIRPLVTTALARGARPVESLALWPVLTGLIFLLQSIGLAQQEMTVALFEDEASGRSLRRFAAAIAAALAVLAGIVALPPVASFFLVGVFGLPRGLAALGLPPLALLAPVVPALALVSFYRGILVRCRTTASIPAGVAINVTTLAAAIFVGTHVVPGPAVNAAALAVSVAQIAETVYLRVRVRAALAAVAAPAL